MCGFIFFLFFQTMSDEQPAKRPRAGFGNDLVRLPSQYENLLPSPLRVGNNKGQTLIQHVLQTMGSSYTVGRNNRSNIVYSCQLVRGMYQTVAVQDIEFINVRFPPRNTPQAHAFSVVTEHRDVLSRVDASRTVAVTENGQWAEKKVKEALISRYAIDNSWYAVMCRTGNENLVRFNNVSLYAKCFHLLCILCDAEDSGNAVALPAAWAQYNNIDLTAAAAAAGVAEWNNAVTNNNIVCFGDDLTDSDILCLRVLAMACPSFMIATAAGAAVANHVSAQVWAATPVTVLYRMTAPPAAPAVAAPTTAAFWAFVMKFAAKRNEQDDLVMGFIRYCVICTGAPFAGRVRAADWCTSTMEFSMTGVPKPGQTNPLLLMLSPPNDPPQYVTDHEALCSQSAEQVQLLLVAAGVILGGQTSTIFQRLQMSGNFMLGLYGTGAIGQLGSALSVGRRELTCIPPQKCAAVYAHLCGSWANHRKWTVSTRAFRESRWGADLGTLPGVNPPAAGSFWAQIGANVVPAVVSAHVPAPVWETFPIDWGIPMYGSGVDGLQLCSLFAPVGVEVGALGDLAMVVGTNQANYNVPLVVLALNIMMQGAGEDYGGVNAVPPVTTIVYTRPTANGIVRSTPPAGAFQMGQWSQALQLWLPGGCLTYNYATNNVQGPFVAAAGLGEGWNAVRALNMESCRLRVGVSSNPSQFALYPALTGGDDADADRAALCDNEGL